MLAGELFRNHSPLKDGSRIILNLLKMKKLFIFFTVLSFALSCSKEPNSIIYSDDSFTTRDVNSISEVEKVNSKVYQDFSDSEYIVKCYLDGIQVEGLNFNLDTDNWVLFLGKLDENENEVLEIRKFTNKNDYLLYGDKNSIPIRMGIEIGETLREYAITHNVIEYFEANGEVPTSYLEYEKSVYEDYKEKQRNNIQSRNLWVQLYKDCKGGQSIPMFNTYPWMPWGWNNKTSANEVVGIFAGTAVYDRTFYRKHRGTVWLWGLQKLCWNGLTINNCMSSGIKLL